MDHNKSWELEAIVSIQEDKAGNIVVVISIEDYH